MTSFPKFDANNFKLPGTCPSWSVEEERERIESFVRHSSPCLCACCGQRVQVYAREISKPIATWLIRLIEKYEDTGDWVSIRTLKMPGGDYAKLLYWGLIEKKPNDDPTKGSSGFWRPTPAGVDFAYGRLALPAPAYVYNNQVCGFGHEHKYIGEGRKEFDYRAIWKKSQ